jgi:hypothetical protein
MTPPESCEKAIKSENIAYTSHVVTIALYSFKLLNNLPVVF